MKHYLLLKKLALILGLLFSYALWGQSKISFLKVDFIKKKNTQLIDSVMITFTSENAKAIDIVYITYGFQKEDSCNLFHFALNLKRKFPSDIIYSITKNIIDIKFAVTKEKLNNLNCLILNISDNQGEYSNHLLYGEEKKPLGSPCKIPVKERPL